MPKFTTTPPPPDGERALPLKRTPALGQLRAIITSPHLVGCNTHFFGGHTVPCEGSDCDAHQAGIPWRWHGYVAALQAGTHLHFLFEFTAQAADTFHQYFNLHQTLRGCYFQAERMHHRPNGRVIIQVKPADIAQINLPKGPDLEACLRIIWHCPAKVTEPATKKNGQPLLHVSHADRTLATEIGLPARPKKGTL